MTEKMLRSPLALGWLSAQAGILARPHRGLLLGMMTLLAFLVLPAWAQAAKVTFVSRPAEVMHKGNPKWVPLNVGDAINAGDVMRTGTGGRVEVMLEAKRVIRMGQASQMELTEHLLGAGGQSQTTTINVKFGRLWNTVARPLNSKKGESFRVNTPTATLGIKGTRFNVDFDKLEKTLGVAVKEGAVAAQSVPEENGGAGADKAHEIAGPGEVAPPQEISREEWQTVVAANQKLVVGPDGKTRVSALTEADLNDDWMRFNEERDQALAAGADNKAK